MNFFRILFVSLAIIPGTFMYSHKDAGNPKIRYVVKDTDAADTLLGEKKTGNIKAAPGSYKVVIKKSIYEMTIYDEDGWYGTYPVVFGNKSQDDKKMEGDRLTPEGSFKIVGKKIHKQWGKFLALDYPTKESYERFNSRKAAGTIPKKATIGGGVGIHGTRPNEEWVIDKFINWTAGCISVRYSDMAELYDMLPVGTEVIIEK